LNQWLAVKITRAIGTMWCAYVFAVLAAYGFPYHNITPPTVIQWVSQEFLQLVLLSVIMVGQQDHGAKLDRIHHHVSGRRDDSPGAP
jgi:hypothetical protein